MQKKYYTIGVDFGTESGRAVIVDIASGEEIATSIHQYTNGVIDQKLPHTDIKLEPDWALQDPNDYLEVLKKAIPDVLKKGGVSTEDVIGIGIDFTACTMLPVKSDGTPLCFLDEWKGNPHAWVKLWKHHAAQDEANRLNEIAEEKCFAFLNRYGGKISSEWFFPKVWQIYNESPEVYHASDRLIEAADWVVWTLTGNETRNSCTAGYKAIWSKRDGFPEKIFFKALDPQLENVVDQKMMRQISSIGQRAGGLTHEAAEWTGLKKGTPVAVANVDAHVAVPASTVVDEGRMVIIMGTSNCHMILWKKENFVPGICGYVEDGIIPGFIGYEAGQSCVGDHFAWLVEKLVPADYQLEAENRGLDLHALLEEKAAQLSPGESGLVALDWWNGNRSILVDVELSGLLLGQTLATQAEEVYRALIEATAFGTRIIIENFEDHNVKVSEIVATGGLPDRNKLLMQIYSDVTGRDVKIANSRQASALGSAMFGAVAAGKANGGYDTIQESSQHMARLREESYTPNFSNKKIYDLIYDDYKKLHDYFGRGQNDVMKRLKRLRAEILKTK